MIYANCVPFRIVCLQLAHNGDIYAVLLVMYEGTFGLRIIEYVFLIEIY